MREKRKAAHHRDDEDGNCLPYPLDICAQASLQTHSVLSSSARANGPLFSVSLVYCMYWAVEPAHRGPVSPNDMQEL